MSNKELFVKAHKITKEIKREYPEVDYMFQFSLCLTYLREEGENSMVELEGTEKQVKWAEDIRKTYLEGITKNREEVKNLNRNVVADYLDFFREEIAKRMVEKTPEAKKQALFSLMDDLVEKVENETRATKFINLYTALGKDVDACLMTRVWRW